MVNLEFVKIFRELFLDIHSQHQTYAFMQPKYHITWLDNYGKELYDRKGISSVHFANQVLTDFDVYTIPLDNLENLKFGELKAESKSGPLFLKGTFKADKGECFVDMSGFTKGFVFVNGFNLGRYWEIGPQKALYLPDAILKDENEIIIFEIEKYKTPEISIVATPMLG